MRKAQIILFLAFLNIAYFSNVYAQPAEAENTSNAYVLTPEDVAAPNPKLSDNVDFTELRNTFGKRSDFEIRCEISRPTKEWADAWQANNFTGAYDVITKWFNKCPVDARAHLWAIATLQKLGDSEKADAHKRWFLGLTDSILKTGDGKTPQTAFVTISVSEEYALLTRFQLKRVMQSLVNGPPTVDLLVVEPVGGGGVQQSIYFNPYWHFVRLSHMFDEKKP